MTSAAKKVAAKAAQGYHDKPRSCGRCAHLKITTKLPAWMRDRNRLAEEAGERPIFSIELNGLRCNPRCSLGDFSVKPSAGCDRWSDNLADQPTAEGR